MRVAVGWLLQGAGIEVEAGVPTVAGARAAAMLPGCRRVVVSADVLADGTAADLCGLGPVVVVSPLPADERDQAALAGTDAVVRFGRLGAQLPAAVRRAERGDVSPPRRPATGSGGPAHVGSLEEVRVRELSIRPARDDELDVVASLTVDAYAEYAAAMAPDAWSMFAQDIANVRGRIGDGELIVAERDDQLVGSVTLFRQWRGAQSEAAGVRLLAVPPEHRQSGIGTALLEHCIAEARAAGKRRVVMTATQEMDSLREMADGMGFQRAPELDHEPAPGVRVLGYALEL